jgi:type III pantothenate kinase
MAEGADDAVIVDAGSAVTVDVLKNGAFIGGSIMPGLDMMLKSLSENTAALPRIAVEVEIPAPPGADTESALRAGTAGALIGGVLRLIELSNAVFDVQPAVFVTGGDAALLIGELPSSAKHLPDLVLSGLNLLYMRKFG